MIAKQKTTLVAPAVLLAAASVATFASAGLQGALPGVGELGGPARQLDAAETEQFLRGRARFDGRFDPSEGLGTPDFNADSCRACHQVPVLGGAGTLELNVARRARDNGGAGPYEDPADGQVLSKLRTPLYKDRENWDPAFADVFEQRQTPPLFGMGLIDSISEAEILSREDPDDLDQDRVRGVARRVDINGTEEIGRFGWKAQLPRLEDFVHDAMANECGVTTHDDGRGIGLRTDGDLVADPELSLQEFDDVAFFSRLLGPPPRGGSQDPAVAQGEAIFDTIGCAKCHVPTLAGADGPVHLYSDLLLHDVMAEDFRGMSEPGAEAGMYRTTPLWGVSHSAPYLHDGRAETIEAAILAHDGEGRRARVKFANLPVVEQQALLTFLEDL